MSTNLIKSRFFNKKTKIGISSLEIKMQKFVILFKPFLRMVGYGKKLRFLF